MSCKYCTGECIPETIHGEHSDTDTIEEMFLTLNGYAYYQDIKDFLDFVAIPDAIHTPETLEKWLMERFPGHSLFSNGKMIRPEISTLFQIAVNHDHEGAIKWCMRNKYTISYDTHKLWRYKDNGHLFRYYDEY